MSITRESPHLLEDLLDEMIHISVPVLDDNSEQVSFNIFRFIPITELNAARLAYKRFKPDNGLPPFERKTIVCSHRLSASSRLR